MLNKTEKLNSDSVSAEDAKEFKNLWLNKTVIRARNVLIDSVASNLFGRYDEKLGLLLSLIGGVPITGKNSIRGKIHVLYVGDPGTGKSQLLKYAHKANPRSVMTSGMSSTGAGLTVT